MNKERLQEIKDSIDLQLTVAESIGTTDEIAEEEKELYNEVIKLQDENIKLKEHINKLHEGLFMCNELKENYKKCNEQAIAWINAKLFYAPNISNLINILQNGSENE